MAVEKYRYFAFLVYPDSVPSDWVSCLRDTHGMYAISPLHTPEDGKVHYHVLYCHGAPTTVDAGVRVADAAGLAANGIVEPCAHPVAYARYLIHLDDPEKQQWAEGKAAITVLNDFPLTLKRQMTADERRGLARKVIEFVDAHDIKEYADLLDALLVFDDELFDFAFSHTVALSRYVDSRRHREVLHS